MFLNFARVVTGSTGALKVLQQVYKGVGLRFTVSRL